MRLILSPATATALFLGSFAAWAEPPPNGASKLPLNVETVKAKLVGYWTIQHRAETIRPPDTERAAHSELMPINGKLIRPTKEQREEFIKQFGKDVWVNKPEGMILRLDADGFAFKIMKARLDGQRPRSSRGIWKVVDENGQVFLSIPPLPMILVESVDDGEIVLGSKMKIAIGGELGPRYMRLVRVTQPPKWATYLSKKVPASYTPKP